jgi:hypothetical protein
LVSNNVEFDYGLLSNYVQKYTQRLPLRYTTKGKYRSIQDFTDFAWLLGIMPNVFKIVEKKVKHDNKPSNDAEHTLYTHLLVRKWGYEISKTDLL